MTASEDPQHWPAEQVTNDTIWQRQRDAVGSSGVGQGQPPADAGKSPENGPRSDVRPTRRNGSPVPFRVGGQLRDLDLLRSARPAATGFRPGGDAGPQHG